MKSSRKLCEENLQLKLITKLSNFEVYFQESIENLESSEKKVLNNLEKSDTNCTNNYCKKVTKKIIIGKITKNLQDLHGM